MHLHVPPPSWPPPPRRLVRRVPSCADENSKKLYTYTFPLRCCRPHAAPFPFFVSFSAAQPLRSHLLLHRRRHLHRRLFRRRISSVSTYHEKRIKRKRSIRTEEVIKKTYSSAAAAVASAFSDPAFLPPPRPRLLGRAIKFDWCRYFRNNCCCGRALSGV